MQVFKGSASPQGSHSPYILVDTTRPRHITYVLVWSKSDQRQLRKTRHKQTERQTDTTKIMVTWPWTKTEKNFIRFKWYCSIQQIWLHDCSCIFLNSVYTLLNSAFLLQYNFRFFSIYDNANQLQCFDAVAWGRGMASGLSSQFLS